MTMTLILTNLTLKSPISGIQPIQKMGKKEPLNNNLKLIETKMKSLWPLNK